MPSKRRYQLVILLLVSVYIPTAAAQSQNTIQAKFAGSIANRMNMVAISCPSGNASFWEQVGGHMFCFRHDFTSFSSFMKVWNTAAEWKGVFAPDPEWVPSEKSAGMGPYLIGNWEWTSKWARDTAGRQIDYEAYQTGYVMHAGSWGFDGSVNVKVEFGVDDSGYTNLLTMLFR